MPSHCTMPLTSRALELPNLEASSRGSASSILNRSCGIVRNASDETKHIQTRSVVIRGHQRYSEEHKRQALRGTHSEALTFRSDENIQLADGDRARSVREGCNPVPIGNVPHCEARRRAERALESLHHLWGDARAVVSTCMPSREPVRERETTVSCSFVSSMATAASSRAGSRSAGASTSPV